MGRGVRCMVYVSTGYRDGKKTTVYGPVHCPRCPRLSKVSCPGELCHTVIASVIASVSCPVLPCCVSCSALPLRFLFCPAAFPVLPCRRCCCHRPCPARFTCELTTVLLSCWTGPCTHYAVTYVLRVVLLRWDIVFNYTMVLYVIAYWKCKVILPSSKKLTPPSAPSASV